MKSLRVPLLVFPLLAGCASPPGYEDPRPAPPSLDWRTALEDGVLVVEIKDPKGFYRVGRVELVGPAGRTYRARELTRETVLEDAGPYGAGVGVGGYGTSGGDVGVAFSFPLGGPHRAPALTLTEARIPLPDPPAYRRTSGRWTIRISLTDRAGVASVAQIPAPRRLPQARQ